MEPKNNLDFFKDHADTIAIIAVNIALFGIALSIALTNISSIAAVNARMDTMHTMIYDLIKEGRK
jgi:hypothetical protein